MCKMVVCKVNLQKTSGRTICQKKNSRTIFNNFNYYIKKINTKLALVGKVKVADFPKWGVYPKFQQILLEKKLKRGGRYPTGGKKM